MSQSHAEWGWGVGRVLVFIQKTFLVRDLNLRVRCTYVRHPLFAGNTDLIEASVTVVRYKACH